VTSLSSVELDSKLNKIGRPKDKNSKDRFEKYDSKVDVSMTERLVYKFTKRRPSNLTMNSFDSSGFQSFAAPNNSIDHDTIQDKIAKIALTSGEQDFNKIRKEAQCRICLGEEEDDEIDDNPLISPCKCNGTMQHIHLECLKKWLDSKIHTKLTDYCFSYNWKNLVCELCGQRLKDNYIVNGKVTYVLDYLRPKDGNYMILESYTNTPHKTIHVLVSNKANNPDNADIEY
jgi:hypothetical protein